MHYFRLSYLDRRGSVKCGQLRWRGLGLGELQGLLGCGVVVADLHLLWPRLSLSLHGLHGRRGRGVVGGRGLGRGRLGSVHTKVSAAVKTTQTVGGTIRVPLSRAPAVAHGTGALLRALVARGGALAHVAVGPGPVSPEGALGRGVEAGGGVAVNIEPPVADEDLLAEDGAVGAEEGHGVEAVRSHGVPEAHVIRLALLLRVGVVAAEHEAVAGEGGLLDAGQDGVVHARLPGNGVPQPVQGVIALALDTQAGPETEAHA